MQFQVLLQSSPLFAKVEESDIKKYKKQLGPDNS